MSSAELPQLKPEELVDALDRHGVEYLVVGGVAARGYGAQRETRDIDFLVKAERENLHRVAAALRELGAYLRVAGLSDEEARALPAQLDGYSLARIEISTWRTDAGDLDILVNIPGADGRRRRYEDLVDAATIVQGTGFAIRAAALKDIIASKQWADRPKDREALPELHHLAAARSEATPGGTGDVVDEQARLTHGDNPDLSAQPGTELGRGTGPAPANEPDSPGLG